jgi:hypothetical protein
MNKTTKLLLTGVTTIGILGIGTAGAMAMTSSLGVKDQAGTVQSITPVTTGSASSTPSASPTPVPTGATTVAPAAPVYLDDKGGERSGASDDSATHEVGDDNGVDPSGHDATDDKSGDSNKSGSDSSTSDSSKSGGSTSGSSDSGTSGSDGGSHN